MEHQKTVHHFSTTFTYFKIGKGRRVQNVRGYNIANLLAHASLDAESKILCHEASLNGLYAHSLKVLSKCGQILIICWERGWKR